MLAFSVFLLWQGIGYTRGGVFRTATNSQINMALVYGAIPVFALLCALHAGAALARDVRAFARREGATPQPAADAE